MIAFLTGRVAARGAGSAVIDVGGVGMTVQCTPSALSRLHVGEEGTVATSLVVREDSLTLFGFADDDEKNLFEQLQTVLHSIRDEQFRRVRRNPARRKCEEVRDVRLLDQRRQVRVAGEEFAHSVDVLQVQDAVDTRISTSAIFS